MSTLISSDWHLNSNPRDADRWNIFPWLHKQINKHDVTHVALLGDLTEEKDRHSAALVNRLVGEMLRLAQIVRVYIIPGNHDYLEKQEPFFAFLNGLRGVNFCTKPTLVKQYGTGDCLFLPHTRDHEKDWAKIDCEGLLVFCHQTFEGARAENGQTLDGIPASFFDKAIKVWSGDVHVPQKIGKRVEYCGAPYHIRFTDTFKPRVVLSDAGVLLNLTFPARLRRMLTIRNLTDLENNDLEMGAQVKIRVILKRAEYPEWATLRKLIVALVARRGWELCGLELMPMPSQDDRQQLNKILEGVRAIDAPEQIVREYGIERKLSKPQVKTGVRIVKGVKPNAAG